MLCHARTFFRERRLFQKKAPEPVFASAPGFIANCTGSKKQVDEVEKQSNLFGGYSPVRECAHDMRAANMRVTAKQICP